LTTMSATAMFRQLTGVSAGAGGYQLTARENASLNSLKLGGYETNRLRRQVSCGIDVRAVR
jgi:hypothetical protein